MRNSSAHSQYFPVSHVIFGISLGIAGHQHFYPDGSRVLVFYTRQLFAPPVTKIEMMNFYYKQRILLTHDSAFGETLAYS